jgi:hypothetical protein
VPQYALALADGSRWVIQGEDEESALAVARLAAVMQLQPAVGEGEPAHRGARRLLAAIGDGFSAPVEDGDGIVCSLNPATNSAELAIQLQRLSLVIARYAQADGGVLLHGALAGFPSARHALAGSPSTSSPQAGFPPTSPPRAGENEGGLSGIILAGPGDVGKTTASQRLPPPWRALCDDTTVVVSDAQGMYWAHPWPTWSRFFSDGPGGSWDVQRAVPLKGVFFLEQSPGDWVEPVGVGHAVARLASSAQQVSHLMTRGLKQKQRRALHLERFENVCRLAQAVPAYLLHVSLTGTFWQEMERVIGKYDG